MASSEKPRRPKDEDLKRIVSWGDVFTQRKNRARARGEHDGQMEWHFGLIGLGTETDTYDFVGLGTLRRVVDPPGEIELARALKQKEIFGAVGRYSHQLTHELSMQRLEPDKHQTAFKLAWWIIAAIRIKSGTEFLVPAVANCSWSSVAGYESEVHVQLLEDVPQARRTNTVTPIPTVVLEWAHLNLTSIAELLEQPHFRLAVDAVTTYHHMTNDRVMLAFLWAGIEALLGVEQELRFRVALLGACVLEPRGPARIELYRRLLRLYDARSKAVHGARVDESKLRAEVVETRRLLADLLCKCVEAKRVFSREELELILLG